MGVKKTVFASKSEQENYYKLKRTWGDKYVIYHDLPFLNCSTPNHTPIELSTQTSITYPNCSKNIRCITGEVVWGQCVVTTYHYDQYLDWVIRLQQQGGSIVEVTFTLRNPDFTITNSDFIVA